MPALTHCPSMLPSCSRSSSARSISPPILAPARSPLQLSAIPAARQQVLVHAQGQGGGPRRAPPSSRSSSDASKGEEERRLEALEASIRGKRPPPRAPRPISVRNSAQAKQDEEDSASTMAPWKEGQLFPEGWETMSSAQKANELWMGRRGMLFWSNKIAYQAVFVLIGSWILFRFVGPGIGLYQLEGNLPPPPS